MTVSATPRKAGPFAGTGAQTAFPFTFKIFATTDVVVTTLVTATGVQAVPVNGVDYAVAMNADQEAAPGGTVNMGVAPAVGVSLVVSSAVPSTQSVAVQNNGGFFPAVFNAEFDKLTILCQQLEERAGRSLAVSIVTGGSATITPLANGVLIWDALGQNIITIAQATLAGNLVFNNATYVAAVTATLAANTNLFGNVNFGGLTAGFPMLKRVGAALAVRLADDSADATLTAKTQAALDATTAVATTAFASALWATTQGFRNRIINGDMRIDQRRAGALVTPTATGYVLDRWSLLVTQASKLQIGQNAGSMSPPAAHVNHIGAACNAGSYAVLATDAFALFQIIEGVNLGDLGWGTASAKPITISFLVRATTTGVYGGAVKNPATRSYPFTYTINALNTWELKTITIPGDTAGTWATDNSTGLLLSFGLGCGANFTAAAGAWTAGSFVSANGATSVVAFFPNQWGITDVQLEAGNLATAFETRALADELRRCQRYYSKTYSASVVPATAAAFGGVIAPATGAGANAAVAALRFPVTMRAAPTITLNATATGTAGSWSWSGNNADSGVTTQDIGDAGVSVKSTGGGQAISAGGFLIGHVVADAEL